MLGKCLHNFSKGIQKLIPEIILKHTGHIEKGFWAVFGVACTTLFVYEAYKLTSQYFEHPVTSRVHTEAPNIKDYGTLYLCCDADQCFGRPPTRSPGVDFARGYWIRSTFDKIDIYDADGEFNPPPGSPSYDAMVAEMKEENLNSVQEFLEFKSDIRYTMDEMDLTKYEPHVTSGTKLLMPKGLLGPFNSMPNTVCFPIPTMTNLNGSGEYSTKQTNGDKMEPFTGHKLVFTVHSPPTYLYYLSFYTGKDWYFIENTAYFKFMMSPEPNVTWGAYFAISISASTEISQGIALGPKMNPDLEADDVACIETTDETIRYPASYAKYECEQVCEEMIYRRFYNCTWVKILNSTKHESNLPMCNHWLHGPINAEEDAHVMRLWEKCVKDHQCKLVKNCDAWDISIQLTSTRGPGTCGSEEHDGNFVRFQFQMTEQMSHIQEVYLVTRSQWFGSVGGLMGMWIGLSIYCVAKCIMSVVCWPLKHGREPVNEV